MGFANAVLVFGLLVGSVGGSLVESTLGIENVFRITGIVTLAMTVIFLITWRKPENLAI